MVVQEQINLVDVNGQKRYAREPCEWRLCHKLTEWRVQGVEGVYCSAVCAALAIVFRDTGIMHEMKEVQHGDS